jgi:prephenate dehydrogenase
MSDTSTFSTITLCGPGLLGGSLVLALRQTQPDCRIQVWGRRDEAVAEVALEPAVDVASTDLVSLAACSDLIILATPVETMVQQAKQMLPALRPGTVVTDVGSVKGQLVQELEAVFHPAGVHFIGSHPMAGKEKAGWEHRDAGIFPGAKCIVTPTAETHGPSLARVEALWRSLGMVLLSMDTATHDRKISRVSHLPHVASVALAWAALKDDAEAAQCAGGGFRDTTRIARGHDGLWSGILCANRQEVIAGVNDLRDRLTELVAILERQDKEELRRYLATSADLLKAGGPAPK